MKKSIVLALVLFARVSYAQDGFPGVISGSGSSGGGGAASAPLTGTGQTITVSTPLMNVTQTWNAGAVTFNALKVNITATASAATSTFFNAQLATVDQFQIRKDGALFVGATTTGSQISFGQTAAGSTTDMFSTGPGGLKVASSFNAGVNQGGSLLLGTADDASGILLNNPGSSQRLWIRGGANGAVRTEVWRLKAADPGGVTASGVVLSGTLPVIATNAPTISSAFGTSPSIVTGNGGSFSFRVNVGTGGTATSGVVGMPTADTGWNCMVNNITAAAGHRADNTVMTTSNTTTVTVENQTKSTGAAVAWTASDIVSLICAAY